MPTQILGYAASVLINLGLGALIYMLASSPATDRPHLGIAGLKRRRAMEDNPSFARIEPLMRHMAGWFAPLPLRGLRARVQQSISWSGDWLGLTPNELFALAVLSALGMEMAAVFFVFFADMPSMLMFGFPLLGAYMPWMQVNAKKNERFREIGRDLPGAIDLAALCIGAGLDFPNAVKLIVNRSTNRTALIEELERILQELELGRTRRKALESFAERVPSEAVRDFVGTVVQAEEKGTPLGEILSIQATMLRGRRSVRAEELAAKAGLMMVGPLMLMFACIILLLMGPFVIQWTNSGF